MSSGGEVKRKEGGTWVVRKNVVSGWWGKKKKKKKREGENIQRNRERGRRKMRKIGILEVVKKINK
jgi:hypothetical protein